MRKLLTLLLILVPQISYASNFLDLNDNVVKTGISQELGKIAACKGVLENKFGAEYVKNFYSRINDYYQFLLSDDYYLNQFNITKNIQPGTSYNHYTSRIPVTYDLPDDVLEIPVRYDDNARNGMLNTSKCYDAAVFIESTYFGHSIVNETLPEYFPNLNKDQETLLAQTRGSRNFCYGGKRPIQYFLSYNVDSLGRGWIHTQTKGKLTEFAPQGSHFYNVAVDTHKRFKSFSNDSFKDECVVNWGAAHAVGLAFGMTIEFAETGGATNINEDGTVSAAVIDAAKLLSGEDVCSISKNKLCIEQDTGYVKSLDAKQFKEVFHKRVFKGGKALNGVEFLIKFKTDEWSDQEIDNLAEVTFLFPDKAIQRKDIKVNFTRGNCFGRGGVCAEINEENSIPGFVIQNLTDENWGLISKETLNIQHQNGMFFDCGYEGMDQGFFILPKTCSLSPYFSRLQLFSEDAEIELLDNQIMLISEDENYFDNLSVKLDQKTEEKGLNSLVSAYENYLTVSDYCGEHKSTNHFQDLKESIGIVLDKLIEEMNIPSSDIEATKDEAFNRAVSNLENNDEHQKMVIMIDALDESQSYKVCKDTVESMAPAYRMMAKQALKSKDKKNRDL